MESIKGWFDEEDQQVYDLVIDKIPRQAKLVEVGVAYGKSLIYLAQRAILAGKNSVEIIGVDIWASHKQFQEFQRNVFSSGVNDLIRPVRAPSALASLMFDERSLDFVMIDADHKYEAVKSDLLNWGPKLKKSGCLAVHDIHLNSVKMAVDEVVGLKNGKIMGRTFLCGNITL